MNKKINKNKRIKREINKNFRVIFMSIIFIVIFTGINLVSFGRTAEEEEAIQISALELINAANKTSDPDTLFVIGDKLFKMGKYDKAKNVFIKGNDEKNILGAATSARFNGEDKVAIDYYSKIISMNNSLEEAYFGRALSYRRMDDYNKAISDFKVSIKLKNNEYAYAGIGDLYILTKKYIEAKEILDKGLEEYPSSEILKSLRNRLPK
ncbi:MAG: tetratricopeptide repeat protein [Fusobacteriaceae bacterium]